MEERVASIREIRLNDDIQSQELILEYPCKWTYKIIALINADIKSILKPILHDRQYLLKLSKKSKNESYISHSLELLVYNDDDRKTIYEQIRSCSEVKIVL